jgi:magnesium-protoporphyrin O-methyltransferase
MTIMDCCQCQGIETQFNRRQAASELETYRRSGPKRTTGLLIDALMAGGVQGETLLDIGGGVGAIQQALLKAGAARATHVDASSAYIAASRAESQRQGHADQVTYRHGDFVDLAADIPPADIVTLDRVICCYHDMPALVGRSAASARRLYGLVYPRDVWWLRAGVKIMNVIYRLQRTGFRIFAHPNDAVDAVVRRNGLERRFVRKTGMWLVVVYARSSDHLA